MLYEIKLHVNQKVEHNSLNRTKQEPMKKKNIRSSLFGGTRTQEA